MTLRRRLIFQVLTSLSAIALLSAAAIVGVRGLRQDFTVALAANAQLRNVYEVGERVALAQAAMQSDPPTIRRAMYLLHSAGQLLDAIEPAPPLGLIDTRRQLDETRSAIRDALGRLNATNPTADALAEPMTALANLSAAARRSIERAQLAADQKHRRVEEIVAALAVLTMSIVITLSWRQHRSLMRPLASLLRAVQRLAAGNSDGPLAISGDREFAVLAAEFNRMAAELRNVQQALESRVEEKSRALIRSDRLASVGYLAAGVAHEINNPLGIIAGYGERSLRRLNAPTSPDDTASLARSIQIICDETFRCKQITDRLLQLARPVDAPASRRIVSLLAAAKEAVAPLAELKAFASRRLVVQSREPAEDDLAVLANEGELRQMLLNLLINALDACLPDVGVVRVELCRDGNEIVLSVIDNGRGMTAETAARVFEPFFTERLTTDFGDTKRIGTGLGLSIVHAIVADHHGRIEARSDGVDRGSAFIVRLPAALRVVETDVMR